MINECTSGFLFDPPPPLQNKPPRHPAPCDHWVYNAATLAASPSSGLASVSSSTDDTQ